MARLIKKDALKPSDLENEPLKEMSNTLKNYSREGQKLPMFGVGP